MTRAALLIGYLALLLALDHFASYPEQLGLGVVTWAVLIARRWWEPEPSWVDRLGCLLGVGWLLMIVGGLIVPLLHIAGMS